MRGRLVACVALASVTAWSAPRERLQTLSGVVVAYSNSPACLNGNGYWSIVIRLRQPKRVPSGFIRLDFSLPCDEFPEWVSAKPKLQQFHLYREESCDAVLGGSAVDNELGLDSPWPIWKYPPGVEHATLPFSQALRCYHSADFPLTPAM